MEIKKVDTKFAVRFAPSPTGYLHIGGARTALFNYLFAKNIGAKFLLRIEDTDKERSTNEAVNAILQGLDWLELSPDEAPTFQSKNIDEHKKAAFKLLENGKAYKCYTSSKELQEMREEAEKKGEIFRFSSPWRDKKSNEDKPFVIRLKAPKTGEITIDDAVQGTVSVKCEEIDDLILLRSDGTPTYMLAVVVDDCNMNITHVIRGDDHFTNTFRQKAIYDALECKAPKFAHIPLINGSDGAKMSKRHGATSVIEYKNMGYLPEAMRNYLLRLGFSHGDDEIISDEKAAKWFNLEHIQKSAARFDFDKLNFLNKHYIKQKSEQELFDLILEFLPQKPTKAEENRIIKALKFLREKPSTLLEIANSCAPYFDDAKSEIESQNEPILNEIHDLLSSLENWNHDSIKIAIMEFLQKKSLKMKDLGPLIRLKLTFSPSSAGGVFDLIEVFGKNLTLARIKK